MYLTFRPGGAQTGESVHERSLEMKILTWRHGIVWKFSPPKGKNFRTKPKIVSKLPTKFSLTALFRRPEDPPNPHPAAGRSQRPVRTIFLLPEDSPAPFSNSQDPPRRLVHYQKCTSWLRHFRPDFGVSGFNLFVYFGRAAQYTSGNLGSVQ